ncbi:MAG: GNAT family N-acetyltransferase [Methanosarcinales archaeon]|nr:GNAT family N-acetyltransferase [Methanosarcinales archaeon]
MFLRQMETEDLDIMLDMAHAEGWSSDRFEFELYLKQNPDGCFTCITDEKVVGGIMTFTYPNSGWIGNLVVDKKYRLKGFGKALFRRGLRQLSSVPTIFLCASPMAVRLYSEFGFKKVSNVNRWERKGVTLEIPENNNELEYVLAVDGTCWREDRSKMLGQVFKNRSLLTDKGAWLGFGRVDDHWTIGPWEAYDKDLALGLLRQSMVESNERHILVDVPAQNTSAWDILTAMGFEVVGTTVLMCRGILPDIVFNNIYGFASMGSKG